MENRISLLLLIVPFFALNAQEPPNAAVEFWIKPHTANTVVSELDSIPIKNIAKFVGAYHKTLLAPDTTFNVVSTGIDTSRAYRTADGNMWVRYDVSTSAGSPDIDLEFWTAPKLYEFGYESTIEEPPPINRFVLVRSLTVTADTTAYWNLFSGAIPPTSWCMFRVKGNAGNGTVAVKLLGLFYTQQQR